MRALLPWLLLEGPPLLLRLFDHPPALAVLRCLAGWVGYIVMCGGKDHAEEDQWTHAAAGWMISSSMASVNERMMPYY